MVVMMSICFCLSQHALILLPDHCSSDSHHSLRHAGPGKPADTQVLTRNGAALPWPCPLVYVSFNNSP